MKEREVIALALCLCACAPNVDQGPTENDSDLVADNMEAMVDHIDDGSTESTRSSSSGWAYDETKDEMRGENSKQAVLSSTNTLSLAFPYGSTQPELHLRKDPKFGFDIYITSDGQPLCRSYNNDTLSVKFDAGPIREWSCAEAADGSSGVVFFNSKQRLLTAIKKSKEMIVEINYYHAGRQQIAFNTEGLKW